MKYIIHIDDISQENSNQTGDKALNLALLKKSGSRVPETCALAASAYKRYLMTYGLDTFILRELRRKEMSDYRWEELWDISLCVKNTFLRHDLPEDIKQEIRQCITERFSAVPVAVRSSAPGEDGKNSSFAGLHESFINLTNIDDIFKYIRMVWASLWSVSALLYRRELGLDPFKSCMAVVIQEVINGDSSGVAFSESPERPECVSVESVHGLNQGLVDGTVEPDRWNVNRNTLQICGFFPASERTKTVQPSGDSVALLELAADKKNSPPLDDRQVVKVARETMRQENHFGHPRDVEWTFRNSQLVILQSRPITHAGQKNDLRAYYDNLLVSFDRLKEIRDKLENVILSGMLDTGRRWKQDVVETLNGDELIKCLVARGKEYRRWIKAYDEYCIPFAHGVRLFGEVYNSKLQPDDPYEFVELLRSDELLSMQRNKKISELAEHLKGPKDHEFILQAFEDLFGKNYKSWDEVPEDVLSFVINYENSSEHDNSADQLDKRFLDCFDSQEKSFALELLDLARASYRLRDDDNLYLEEVKTGLQRVIDVCTSYLAGKKFTSDQESIVETELALGIPELHSPSVVSAENVLDDETVKFRQLIGQPAGKGNAQGRARVVRNFDDLFGFQKGEVLVCDAVEPEMTFVAPLACAVVERRGGMLIHGAIIAREYGLPCVTGVPDATCKIKTGDMVAIDGWLGIITIL
jgi:pyruvate,water dikinase